VCKQSERLCVCCVWERLCGGECECKCASSERERVFAVCWRDCVVVHGVQCVRKSVWV